MNWVSSILRRADAVSGHRILYVSPDGPGDAAGLVPFFDLITAVEGEVLNETDASLAITISKHVGQLTELSVYNVKTRLTRATFIVCVRCNVTLASVNTSLRVVNADTQSIVGRPRHAGACCSI